MTSSLQITVALFAVVLVLSAWVTRYYIFTRFADGSTLSGILEEATFIDFNDLLSVKLFRMRKIASRREYFAIMCYAVTEWMSWLFGLLFVALIIA